MEGLYGKKGVAGVLLVKEKKELFSFWGRRNGKGFIMQINLTSTDQEIQDWLV